MQYTKQNQRRVLTHSPIFYVNKMETNMLTLCQKNEYYKVDAAVCPQRFFMPDILTVVCSLMFLFSAIQNRRHWL